MPKKIEPFWEGYITALSDTWYSYSAIIRNVQEAGFVYFQKWDLFSIGLIPKGKKQAHPRPTKAAPLKWSEKLKPLSREGIQRLKEV